MFRKEKSINSIDFYLLINWFSMELYPIHGFQSRNEAEKKIGNG